MIIDNVVNAAKYYCIHPLFAKAFEHIQSLNTATIETGTYEIDGERLRAIVSDKPGKTASESKEEFECHNKNIDLQF